MLQIDHDWLDHGLDLLRLDHLVLNQKVLLKQLLLLLFCHRLDLALRVYRWLNHLDVQQLWVDLNELCRLCCLL
jgi:hypothetical protein